MHGSGAAGVFYLNAPGNADITISGLTITGGHTAQGGGIENTNEHLTVVNDTITGNAATKWGGGISTGGSRPLAPRFADGDQLDRDRQHAGDGGGGIYADDSTSVNIDSSSVSNNTATDNGGGGLYINTVDALTITNSQIDGNTTDGSGGGGLYLNDIEGALHDHRLVDAGNTTTSGEGGGLYADYVLGAIDMAVPRSPTTPRPMAAAARTSTNRTAASPSTNPTISGNTTGDGDNGGGLHFGFFYEGVTIQSTTISGNTAAGAGGGVWSDGGYGNFVVHNSTVSGNTASSGWGGGLYVMNNYHPMPVRTRRSSATPPATKAVQCGSAAVVASS